MPYTGPIFSSIQIPLTVASNARILRVVGFNPPDFAPGRSGGAFGIDRQQDGPPGPPNWYHPNYDDSGWTLAPALAVTDPLDPPRTIFHMNELGGDILFEGDPVWITSTESDPDAIVLVRWWVTPPANALFNDPYYGPILTGMALIDWAESMSGPFLGLNNNVNGFGSFQVRDMQAGVPNLMTIAIPGYYRGIYGTASRSAATATWFKLSLLFVLGDIDNGTSTTHGWGRNTEGALGIGHTSDRHVPVRLLADTGFDDVVTAQFSSWGRIAGSVFAWGANTAGELGNGTTDTTAHVAPELVTHVTDVVQIAASAPFHDESPGARCFALTAIGDLYGWGENALGELGTGDFDNRASPFLTNTNVARVTAGCRHSMVLKVDGTLWGVGDGSAGQLGLGYDGFFALRQDWTRTILPVATQVIDVLAGSLCTWVLLSDGSVWGTGSSAVGELGIVGGSLSWILLPLLTNIVRLGTSGRTLYAVDGAGVVWSLGSNVNGALGTGSLDPDYAIEPRVVHLPSGVTLSQIIRGSAATAGAIAIASDGQVYTWGDGTSGQRGDGTIVEDNPTPESVNGLEGVTWVGGASPSYFTDSGPPETPIVLRGSGHSRVFIVG